MSSPALTGSGASVTLTDRSARPAEAAAMVVVVVTVLLAASGSLTVLVTLAVLVIVVPAAAASGRTTIVTVVLPPMGMMPRFSVTTPLSEVTPPVAETNVTWAGSVSVTVTGPDGALVPVLVTVMV